MCILLKLVFTVGVNCYLTEPVKAIHYHNEAQTLVIIHLAGGPLNIYIVVYALLFKIEIHVCSDFVFKIK